MHSLLGMGSARGRIYTKHPELFRYQCDASDKNWLRQCGWLTSPGVKAYLMHFEQVRRVAASRRGAAAIVDDDGAVHHLHHCFAVPPWLLSKVSFLLLCSATAAAALR